jgi:hypothetical protein
MTGPDNQNPFGSISIAGDGNDLEPKAAEPLTTEAAEPSGFKAEPLPTTSPGGNNRSSHRRQMPKSRKGKLLWLLVLPLIGFVSYLLAGYLLAPYLLKHLLPAYLARTFEREVTVGTARFDPLGLTITLQNGIIGPRISDPDDVVDPLLAFGRLKLDLAAASLLRFGMICRRVEMERFFLHVVRKEDATYNLQDLLPAGAREKSGFFPGRFRFSLNNVMISDSRLLFEDRPAGRTHQIEEMSLALPVLANIAYRPNHYLNPRFSAKINGSPINLTGETRVGPEALEARLSLRLKQLEIASYFGYLPTDTNFAPAHGLADLDLHLVIQTDAPADARLQIEGTGKLLDVLLQSTADGRELARIPAAQGVVSFAPLSGRYRLKELTLQQPEFFLDRDPDGQWSLPGITISSGAVEIDRLQINGGRLAFTDRRVSGGFADNWSEINLSIAGFATDSSKPATFAISGRNRDQARISAQGHLFSLPFRVEGFIIGHQLQLASFNPYLEEMKRVRFQSGELVKIETAFSAFSGQGGINFTCTDLAGRIENLAMAGQDENWLRLPQVTFSRISIHWPARDLQVGNLLATGGSLLMDWDQEGRLNWSNISTAERDQWQLTVNSTEFSGTAFIFRTAALPEPLTMRLLDTAVTISNLAESWKGQGSLKATGTFADGGQVELAGAIALQPLTANLSCRIDGLFLPSLNPLVSGWFRPEVETGILQADGEINLPNRTFRGSASISQFAASLEQKEIFRWQGANLSDLTLDFAAGALHAENIFLQQPFVNWAVAGRSGSNLAGLFDLSWTREDDTPRLKIGRLTLESGELAFTDLGASPPYRNKVSEITGTIGPLVSSGTSLSHIDLTGRSNDQAVLLLRGVFEPFAQSEAELQIEARQVALAPLAPYVSDTIGYRLTGGNLDLLTAVTLKRQQLQGANRLSINGLQFGQQLDRTSRLPLAVALHTDKEGHLEIELPVSGHAGNPDFSYREELRRAIRHLLLKTAISPYSFLENVAPAGTLQEHLIFTPGQAELTPENRKQLQHLAEVLGKRPRLGIVLHGFADDETDRSAIRNKRGTTARIRHPARALPTTQNFHGLRAGEEILPPGAGTAVPEPTLLEITNEELQELASTRCENVSRYLANVHGIPATRVTIGPASNIMPPATSGRRGNRVDIELKAMK